MLSGDADVGFRGRMAHIGPIPIHQHLRHLPPMTTIAHSKPRRSLLPFAGGTSALLTSALLSLLLGTAPSRAQQATTTTTTTTTQPAAADAKAPESAALQTPVVLEAVTGSGVRASLITAQEIKENSPEFVDSIVAQDIGKLPDNSVADALQRVPGVQVARANGEVEPVVIRGLPNIETTLNGHEVFTGTGRGVAYEDIPAEMLAGLDVYKSVGADKIEGGVAGLIDVRLHRPFDFNGPEFAVTSRGYYSDQAKKDSYNLSFLASDRWKTSSGEFGALVDVSPGGVPAETSTSVASSARLSMSPTRASSTRTRSPTTTFISGRTASSLTSRPIRREPADITRTITDCSSSREREPARRRPWSCNGRTTPASAFTGTICSPATATPTRSTSSYRSQASAATPPTSPFGRRAMKVTPFPRRTIRSAPRRDSSRALWPTTQTPSPASSRSATRPTPTRGHSAGYGTRTGSGWTQR